MVQSISTAQGSFCLFSATSKTPSFCENGDVL